MTPAELKRRIRTFALRCLKLVASFPRGAVGEIIGRQLIKACTSAAANYNATCVARSRADFIAKMGIVHEELDESVFWVDFAADAGLSQRPLIEPLLGEGTELLAIVVTAKGKTNQDRKTKPPGGGI